VYFRSLAIGTAVIALLNVLLIPRLGVAGAIQAAVLSTVCVVLVCAAGMSRHLPRAALAGVLVRLVAALTATWAVATAVGALGAPVWLRAVAGCCVYPLAALLVGLVPNPGRSILFARRHSLPAT
jgi:hypothetical protein